MRNVKTGEYPLNHQFQGMRLYRKKTEKYQGMRHAREEFSSDIRLTDYVDEERFNPLGNAVNW